MALDTFQPPVAPSPGTQKQYKPRLKQADFGDGYTQPTRDGLNHIRRVVPLKWTTLTETQAKAIEDFLIEKGGDTPFLYALTDDVTRQWRCEQWNRSLDTPNTITATFNEDFSIVV
jgi:phage-related protein